MRTLSKSKLIAFRQCAKRLWLEVNQNECRDDTASQMAFAIGEEAGALAHTLYDRKGSTTIDIGTLGWKGAFDTTSRLLEHGESVIFEAALKTNGALAMVDVMVPQHDTDGDLAGWEMIEVKASTKVKDYHRNDVAIQAYIATQAGVAHINNKFVYKGGNDYSGLLKMEDLTYEAKSRTDEVKQWIDDAQKVAARTTEPVINMGGQCWSPFPCSFQKYCSKNMKQPEFSPRLLPAITNVKLKEWADQGIRELRDTPDDELNPTQRVVKAATLENEMYFDQQGAKEALMKEHHDATESYFLDFETVQFTLPIWVGTSPYEQLPFQFSLHQVNHSDGTLFHEEFLDTSGKDPREALCASLVSSCGTSGPIYVYSAQFERRVVIALSRKHPKFAKELVAIRERMVDLLPIARKFYYHPDQQGSWSLKAVSPTLIMGEGDYSDLEGVQFGLEAVVAFRKAISPDISTEERDEIRTQLLEYCKQDTLATVRMWELFRGIRVQHENATVSSSASKSHAIPEATKDWPFS